MFLKRKLITSTPLILTALLLSACTGGNKKSILVFPDLVAVDSAKGRVFIVDNQDNGLNLLNASDNQLVLKKGDDGDEPLLTQFDPPLLPVTPTGLALYPLDNDTSRLFVIGANPSPSLEVTVLDYNDAQGLHLATPILVPGNKDDILVGVAVDAQRQHLFVSNTTSGLLHIFDIATGIEIPESPISIGAGVTQLALDFNSTWLAAANSLTTQVSFIDLQNLATPPQTLEVGINTRDVALTNVGQDVVLFLSGNKDNVARVYRLNLADFANSALLAQVAPVEPGQPDPEILTGNLNQVVAGVLTNGEVAGLYTQSSGDVLKISFPANLNSFVPVKIEVGAISGEGIAGLFNAQGQMETVYFASPGLGVLTIINPLENEFEDQIN